MPKLSAILLILLRKIILGFMSINIPRVWVFILLLVSIFTIDTNRVFSQDDKAQAVIQASQSFFLGLRDISIDFSYEVKGVSAIYGVQNGTLHIKKARYVLTMEDQETYCDTKNIWVYLPKRNEYMVFDMGEWTYGNIMQLIYSMYFYSSDTEYKGIETLDDGSRAHKVRFLMNDPNINYTSAYAWYDTSSKLLTRVTFLDRSRRQRTYSFYNLRYNSGLSNDTFVFYPREYPGIKLRR